MAGEVKLELARVPVQSPALRRVEVAAVMRFAGELHTVDGQLALVNLSPSHRFPATSSC